MFTYNQSDFASSETPNSRASTEPTVLANSKQVIGHCSRSPPAPGLTRFTPPFPVLASLQQRLPLKVYCAKPQGSLQVSPMGTRKWNQTQFPFLIKLGFRFTASETSVYFPVHYQFPTLYVSLSTEGARMCNVFFWFLISPPNSEKLVPETMLLILFSTLLVFY